ncbi:hypothetical protein BJ546DRAFT_962447, partial [Cryomyces antarcticus]
MNVCARSVASRRCSVINAKKFHTRSLVCVSRLLLSIVLFAHVLTPPFPIPSSSPRQHASVRLALRRPPSKLDLRHAFRRLAEPLPLRQSTSVPLRPSLPHWRSAPCRPAPSAQRASRASPRGRRLLPLATPVGRLSCFPAESALAGARKTKERARQATLEQPASGAGESSTSPSRSTLTVSAASRSHCRLASSVA